MTVSERSRRPDARTLGWLLAACGLFVFNDTVADPDLWGHVRFGQDIVRAASISRVDPYSHLTEGNTWINHEWLAEVAFAVTYDHVGASGLIALKTAIGLVILITGYVHLVQHGLRPWRATSLMLLVALILRMGLGTIRPQMFTYLLFLAVLRTLDQARRREAWLWLAVPLVALWVNLHGGVLAGLGVLGLWGVARLFMVATDRGRSPARRVWTMIGIVAPLLSAVGAPAVNPYGWRLPAFLLRTATAPRPEITEWAPLALNSLAGLLDLVLLAIAVAGLVASRRPRDPGGVLVVSVTALLPMLAQRHLPLFALAVVVLAGEHIADVWERIFPGRVPRPSRFRAGWTAVSWIATVALAVAAWSGARCIRLDPRYWPYPAQAVALIRASGVEGGLVLPFDWGEYALWHLGPRVRVAMDGRRETVYPDGVYREYLDFIAGRGRWDAFLERPGTDMALLGVGSPACNLLRLDSRWFRVYEDGAAVLFVRTGSPLAGPLGTTPPPARPVDGGGLCFP